MFDPDHRKLIFGGFPEVEKLLRFVFKIFGPEIIDVWSPRGSRNPGPSRNFTVLRRISIQPAGAHIGLGFREELGGRVVPNDGLYDGYSQSKYCGHQMAEEKLSFPAT